MPSRNLIEPSILACMGVGLLILAIPGVGLNLASQVVPSELWETREQVLSTLLFAYSLIFFVGAYGSFGKNDVSRSVSATVIQESQTLLRRLRSQLRTLPERIPEILPLTLSLIVLIGAILRLKFLSQPMRYDESYTYLEYVDRAPQYLFLYSDPNNHVGQTILVKLSILIFGSSPVFLRLPAFLAGIFSILIGFHLAKKMFSREAGFLFAALLACFPYLVLYDTMARGYSLIVLLSLLQVLATVNSANGLPKPLLFAVLTACGLFVMPSYLFFAVGIVLWLSVTARLNGVSVQEFLKQFLRPFSIACCLLTFVLYSPVILVSNGISPIVSNRFVESISWSKFISRLPSHVVETARQMSRGNPFSGGFLIAVFFLIGSGVSIKKKDWQALLLLPVVMLGCLGVLVLKRAIPFDRTWIFLLPLFLLQVANGFTECVRKFTPPSPRMMQLVQVGSLLMVFEVSYFLIQDNVIAKFEDTGSYPQAEIFSQHLIEEIQSGERIGMSDSLLSVPMNYYLAQQGVPPVSLAEEGDQPVVYIHLHRDSLELRDVAAYEITKEFDQTSVYRQR